MTSKKTWVWVEAFWCILGSFRVPCLHLEDENRAKQQTPVETCLERRPSPVAWRWTEGKGVGFNTAGFRKSTTLAFRHFIRCSSKSLGKDEQCPFQPMRTVGPDAPSLRFRSRAHNRRKPSETHSQEKHTLHSAVIGFLEFNIEHPHVFTWEHHSDALLNLVC